jgi:RhtB (resistance to homoserine/threonine) family protein
VGIHLWPFIGISVLVVILPGPDTMVVTKNALLHGRAAALGTSLGVSTGLVIWTGAAALGLAAVIRESAVAFTVLKFVGAVYLVVLGLQTLRSARRDPGREQISTQDRGRRIGAALGFRQGLLTDLGNPKIAVFFTSLLPQFVSPGDPVLLPFLLLGGVFVAITLTWLSGYSIVATRISRVLTRPRVKASLDRLTGVVLIGFGVRLALERR